MIFEEDVDSFLLRYLLNELDPEDRKKVEEWIVANEENRQYYQAYQKTHLELRWMERSKKIEGNFIQFDRLRRKQHFRRVFYRSVACAIILLSVGGAFRYWDGEPKTQLVQEGIQPGKSQAILYMASGQVVSVDKDAQELKEADGTCINVDSVAGMTYNVTAGENSSEVLYNRVVVPKGGEFKLTLSDGTKVWLNSLTKLRYPEVFKEDCREVYLTGEAYFEVKHDAERPFVVVVDGMKVAVYGTRFNVNTYHAGVVQTVLVDGKVGVQVDATGKEIVLHPNEMATYSEESQQVNVKAIVPYVYTAWKDGKFVFDEEPVEEIMKRLSRWYGIKVVYKNEQVKEQLFTGIITRYAEVKDVLHLIEETALVHFYLNGNVVTVSTD